MDIKKPTEAELTAWLKDNGFDHDLPATSIGDLLKEYMNKVETPADYVFDPKTPIKPRREPTVHNIDLTKKTPEDYWRKLALDFRADRDRLQKQVDESGASYRQTIDRITMQKNEMRERLLKQTDVLTTWNSTLNNENDKLREEVDKYIEAIKENNAAHHETHKELKLVKQEAEDKQQRIDNLRAEWSRTIDLALAYEDKLQQINKEYPGILGGEELRALMMTNSNKA